MRSISDDLALAQCPVSNEDLVVYILTQLGEEYNAIISAVRICETPISLGELADILTYHERQLNEVDVARQSLLATANVTQHGSFPSRRNHNYNNNNNNGNNRQSWPHGGNNRSGVVCQFCNFSGHEMRVCRMLA